MGVMISKGLSEFFGIGNIPEALRHDAAVLLNWQHGIEPT
jgi:hypothetical protein